MPTTGDTFLKVEKGCLFLLTSAHLGSDFLKDVRMGLRDLK